MDLKERHLNDFARTLEDAGLPTDPTKIVGRIFQFTTASMGTDGGISLLAEDDESLEASSCSPLTVLGTVSGVSYDDFLCFIVLHFQPLYFEKAGFAHSLFISEPGTARLVAEKPFTDKDDYGFLGKFKLL